MPVKKEKSAATCRFIPTVDCLHARRYWTANKVDVARGENVYTWEEGDPCPSTHMEPIDDVPPVLQKLIDSTAKKVDAYRRKVAEEHRRKLAANSGITADIERLKLQNETLLLELKTLNAELELAKVKPAKAKKTAAKKDEPAGADALG